MEIIWQNHVQKCKEGNLFLGLCGLLYWSVYHEFESSFLIPFSGTIFILQLLDFLLDVTKNGQIGLLILISQIFKTFVKPHSIDPNVLFHFPTTMREADTLLLRGSNRMYVNFPVKDVYIINKHACISLVQKLDHSMAHGIDFLLSSNGDWNQGTEGINNYPAAIELQHMVKRYVRGNDREVADTAIRWIILWSDSFVVHLSKQKHNSMLILTATTCLKTIWTSYIDISIQSKQWCGCAMS